MNCNKPIYNPNIWNNISNDDNNITNCYSYSCSSL